MVGTIKDTIYIGKNKIIIYDDIDTSPGQSGSPVYLKTDGGWLLIGFHVGSDPYANVNIATAIQAEVQKWIVETLTYIASEKSKNKTILRTSHFIDCSLSYSEID